MPPEITQDLPVQDPPASLEMSPPIQPIQPIETPSPAPIDPAYARLLEGTVTEQNRRIAELERHNTETSLPALKRTKEEERQDYFDSPMEATRKLIHEELNATITPLVEFVASMKGQTAIDRIIENLKINPRFQRSWNAALEKYVREQASQVDPSRLSENALSFVVLAGIGLQATGEIAGAPVSVNEPPRREPVVPIPPHMRPSAPASPESRETRPKHRELNENEKRILREYNATKSRDKQMTEAQYIEWQSVPANEVARTQFDRPATPPAGAR